MKNAPLALLLGMTMLAVPGSAQTTPSDSQTLKEILTEIRTIHADVRLSQTTQLLLVEWQIQGNAVARALERRDKARTDLDQFHAQKKLMEANLEAQPDFAADPQQLAEAKQAMMGSPEALKITEDRLSQSLQEAEEQLQKEQALLGGIQKQLDDVVKQLQPPTVR